MSTSLKNGEEGRRFLYCKVTYDIVIISGRNQNECDGYYQLIVIDSIKSTVISIQRRPLLNDVFISILFHMLYRSTA